MIQIFDTPQILPCGNDAVDRQEFPTALEPLCFRIGARSHPHHETTIPDYLVFESKIEMVRSRGRIKHCVGVVQRTHGDGNLNQCLIAACWISQSCLAHWSSPHSSPIRSSSDRNKAPECPWRRRQENPARAPDQPSRWHRMQVAPGVWTAVLVSHSLTAKLERQERTKHCVESFGRNLSAGHMFQKLPKGCDFQTP